MHAGVFDLHFSQNVTPELIQSALVVACCGDDDDNTDKPNARKSRLAHSVAVRPCDNSSLYNSRLGVGHEGSAGTARSNRVKIGQRQSTAVKLQRWHRHQTHPRRP